VILFRLALYGLVFLSIFNFTSPLMGSVYIIGELGGSSDIVSYPVAFFGLGNACSFPFTRVLADRFGKSRILLFFSLFFLITLFVNTFMPTFFLFNLVRFFNGFTCGVFFPLGVGLLDKINTDAQKKRFMPCLAFLVSITPVLGASFGGSISYEYDWRLISLLQIPFTLFCIFILYRNLKTVKESYKDTPYDIVGYISYLVSIVCLTSFVILGQQLDWLRSPFLCTLLAIGIVFLPFFVLWECNHKNPIIDLKIFKIPVFTVSSITVFVLFSAYFGMVILLSVWLHFDVNYTSNWIALLMMHMIIASTCLFFFVLKWMKKTPPFLPVALAIIGFTISCFYSSYFNAEINFGRIAISRILAGFGLAFFFFPLFTICLDILPSDKKEQGVAIFQSCRLLSGAFGVSFYHTLFIRRIVFYHERLGEDLTIFNPKVMGFFKQLSLFHETGIKQEELLEKALHTQASALGLADCFYAMGWMMVALLVFLIIFILRRKETRKPSPSPEG